MRTLLVLGHYDDEAIACPQYLIDHPGSTVFVACGDDPKRQEAFYQVMDDTLCHSLLGGFKPLDLRWSDVPALAKAIDATIGCTGIDRVITHHPDDVHFEHKIVSNAVQVALRRHPDVELFFVRNPEGFPFENVVNTSWDTVVRRTDDARQLVMHYDNINRPEDDTYEYYQTVRRLSMP